MTDWILSALIVIILLLAFALGFVWRALVVLRQQTDRRLAELRNIVHRVKSVRPVQPLAEQLADFREQSEAILDDVLRGAAYSELPPEDRLGQVDEQLVRELLDRFESIQFAMRAEKISAESLPTGVDRPIGLLYCRMARFEPAQFHLSRYIKAYPDDNEGLYFYGLAEARLFNYEKAIKAFSAFVAHDNSVSAAYLHWGANLGKLYDETGQGELVTEARQHFETAIELDATNSRAWFNLGLAFEAEYRLNDDPSRLPEILRAFERVVELDDASGRAYYYRARAYSLNGDTAAAAEDLRQAIQFDKSLADRAKNEKLFDDIVIPV